MSRHESQHPAQGTPVQGNPGGGAPWLPDGDQETLLVSGLEVLRAEVERIVAAAGGRLRTVPDVREAAPLWDAAETVLIGSDIRELPPRKRAPAVLVGTGQ